MLTRAVGVVVPAHDEEADLPGCLAALRWAAEVPGVPSTRIVVVADDCRDGTAATARRLGTEVIEVRVRSAGAARRAGLDHVLATTTVPLDELWLATTDADSRVPPAWLAHQVRWRSEGWDAFTGTVVVGDWSAHPPSTARRFQQHYGPSRDGHPHVHGASLGLSGAAYDRIGGFPPMALAEDHAVVTALVRCGLGVARRGGVPVRTSARPDPRAPGGFGDLLLDLARDPAPFSACAVGAA